MGLASVIFGLQYPHAKVLGVELSPQNCEVLKMNTGFLPNVIPINAGLFNTVKTMYFTNGTERNNTRKHKFIEGWGYVLRDATEVPEGSGGVQVKTVTIDLLQQMFGIKNFDLIKMDVEGSELEIFSNGTGGYDPHSWFQGTQLLMAETHDRIKEGCTAAIYNVVKDYPYLRKTIVGEYETWYDSALAFGLNTTAERSRP